jgi:hypothetical protein
LPKVLRLAVISDLLFPTGSCGVVALRPLRVLRYLSNKISTTHTRLVKTCQQIPPSGLMYRELKLTFREDPIIETTLSDRKEK